MTTVLTFLTLVAWVVLIVWGGITLLTVWGMARHFQRLDSDPAYRLRFDLHRQMGGSDIEPHLLRKILVVAIALAWLAAARGAA